ncbi:Cobalamin (vitamin B12) biosynthesis CbiG, core [Moorella glycerini]|uniref:Cobalamin biosynthesis protein CbiG n=1 Tax=Neomoorella stamsii TaxID=1266720 RepID=A0A9X7J2N2_9FIRM|nr:MULTISPECIES: cobalamin biosynthesis protein [Moorella]PRR71478.1 cobalamin biosynthesis protein CbiG [Moorella stamsii]CEP68688.1 Cobalamin (vitamin B12) biosynthesis CbiG, core [Moorella glycerini]
MAKGQGIAIVTLTRPGLQTALQLAHSLSEGTTIFIPADLAPSVRPEIWDQLIVVSYSGPLSLFLGQIFNEYRGLILVMAAGIAVRALSPHLVSKNADPAVVVVDVGGKYAISLLSGHLGGANELARRVASLLGGQAVITTASEVQGLPPLDLVARELNMSVWPAASFTKVMAALVNGETVDLLVEKSLLKSLEEALPSLRPRLLTGCPAGGEGRAGIMVTWRRLPLPGPRWVYWRPQVISAGIGCRRGVPAGTILYALGLALREAGLSRRSLAALASVDFKGEEPGLQRAAGRLGVKLLTFTPWQLAACMERKPHLHRSERVNRYIGIPGVCEPAAILAAGEGELIWPKMSYRGVTVALARAK